MDFSNLIYVDKKTEIKDKNLQPQLQLDPPFCITCNKVVLIPLQTFRGTPAGFRVEQ